MMFTYAQQEDLKIWNNIQLHENKDLFSKAREQNTKKAATRNKHVQFNSIKSNEH